MPDFTIVGRSTDTVFLLWANNALARDWIEEHVIDKATTRFNQLAVAVEHRFADDIVAGIKADGLTINWRPV